MSAREYNPPPFTAIPPDKQESKQDVIIDINTKHDKIEKKSSLIFGNIKINRNFAVQNT